MDSKLKKLADIVSSKNKIIEYKINRDLPEDYNKLINIDKNIIEILDKINNKPIEYEILGKFQKMFLLNKNELNRQIKLSKTLLDKINTLYELEKKEKDENDVKRDDGKDNEDDDDNEDDNDGDDDDDEDDVKDNDDDDDDDVKDNDDGNDDDDDDVKDNDDDKDDSKRFRVDNQKVTTIKTKLLRFIQELKRKKYQNTSIKKIKFNTLNKKTQKNIKNIKDEMNRVAKKNIIIDPEDNLETIWINIAGDIETLKEIDNYKLKYIKLLNDINHIKKYIKYKMKYNILKKNKFIKI